VRVPIIFLTTVAVLCGAASAHAQLAHDSLRIYVTDINGLTGVYLGKGLVLTAAHVVGPVRTNVSVRIAGSDVSAKVIKAGSYDDVDLSLLSVEAASLPIRVQMRRIELCGSPPIVGQPVIVAGLESSAPSTIASPMLLPPNLRTKFSTIIVDVASTGNSGSGVFDAGKKCLLGIMSQKLQRSKKETEGSVEDIAKYFVPASTIRGFIPPWYRF
jgi:S1-C subfamily serine protease